MPKTKTEQTRGNAIYASSPEAPTSVPERTTSRASTQFVKNSLRKLHSSSSSNSSQVAELQKALQDAKLLNAKHQEEIQVLTLERDAAEDTLHDNKRHYRALMEDFIDLDKELEATGASLKKAVHENEAQKASLAEKDREISELCTANAKYEQGLREVVSEKVDLETWIAEIKACVMDVNTYHHNLETKSQTQNHIIGHLKSEVVTLQRSLSDYEMNKKAVLRSNAALKRKVENLKGAVVEEQEKAKSGVNWKAQCMLDHRRKMLEMEELEAEVEVLRVVNGELCEGLEILGEEFVREEEEGDGEGAEKGIWGREAVMVADLPPSEAIRGNAESVEISQSTMVGRGKREFADGIAGPLVLLGCLLAALFLRL